MFFVFRPFYFVSPILQVCSSDEPCIPLGMIFCIVHGFCIKFSYWFSFIPFILHFFCAGTSLGKTQKNSTLDLLFFFSFASSASCFTYSKLSAKPVDIQLFVSAQFLCREVQLQIFLFVLFSPPYCIENSVSFFLIINGIAYISGLYLFSHIFKDQTSRGMRELVYSLIKVGI